MTTAFIRSATFASLTLLACAAHAEVQVKDPWVRASVEGQQATGAFMELRSTSTTTLVAVESPIAAVSEIHEMTMHDDVMRMREIPGIELPAGTPVELKPGGYHIMLMQLKAPATAGTSVPLELTFEDAAGKTQTLRVDAPVRALGTRQPQHGHGGHGH